MTPEQTTMHGLRAVFEAVGYDADGVLAAIGEAGQDDLRRNHTLAADRALAGRTDPLATLIRLFVLQQWQPAESVDAALPVEALAGAGVLAPLTGGYRAMVDVRPVSDETDGLAGWVVSDHAADLDTANRPPAPDHVLGVSPASISLAGITPRRPVGRALDLGTGSGIQSLHLARHADAVVATDVNQRALHLARMTFALNGVVVDTRAGSLYTPVEGEGYDLIVANPPFVISPHLGERLMYRETGHTGDDLMRAVVAGAGPRLNPGGSLHVVGNWAHVRGTSVQDRLAAWVPPDCDAYIVQRELLDVCAYTEVWLADAGLAGTPAYRDTAGAWLDYFDALGIEAVGLGWITMVKRDAGSGGSAERSHRVAEDWPYPVTDPVADDLMAHLAARTYADWDDAHLLATRWRLAEAVQETTAHPGTGEVEHVVLRRTTGLNRAIEVDAGLGGVLGACDGDLTLGQITGAVARLLGVGEEDLRASVLPRLRELIAQTWLTPVARFAGFPDPGLW